MNDKVYKVTILEFKMFFNGYFMGINNFMKDESMMDKHDNFINNLSDEKDYTSNDLYTMLQTYKELMGVE